jgi:flagellar protein FlgJ
MSTPIGGASPTPNVPQSRDAALHKAAQQLEGVFVNQLFQAMRATVPEDGFAGGGSAEQTFTAMMDEHVAAETPSQWSHGLADALYRQFRGGSPTSSNPVSKK